MLALMPCLQLLLLHQDKEVQIVYRLLIQAYQDLVR